LVHEHVLRFIVSEVKMPCSCYPKAKAIQSRARKQNNCPSFGTKSTSSRIPTEQTSLMSIPGGGGIPRKVGWGYAARFSKPLPYLGPKSAIFPTLFMT